MKFGILLIDPDIEDDYTVSGVFDTELEAENVAYSYKNSGMKVFVIPVWLHDQVEDAE